VLSDGEDGSGLIVKSALDDDPLVFVTVITPELPVKGLGTTALIDVVLLTT